MTTYALDKAAAITRAIEVVDQQIGHPSVNVTELQILKARLIELRTELQNEAVL